MTLALPAEVSIGAARLPASYEAAKLALSTCESIDECQGWANKAEALASYAKQADDDTLRKMADRIQARAVRRCGELLKQFDARPGNATKQSAVAHTLISRQQIAADAGMSRHQQVTAVRVANIPTPTFERAIESDAPPTVTRLAEMGKQPRAIEVDAPAPMPAPPREPAPLGFKQATQLIGTVRRFAEFCEAHQPEAVATGVLPYEAADLRRNVATIDSWLDRFVVNLKGE